MYAPFKTRSARFWRKNRKKGCFPRGKPEKCVRIVFSALHDYA
ncbi:hypothetical protein EC253486_5488 [Escherichia coli 2534-86]|nr:hypothetical protein EC253486_5488 [Escherichia coli 2534-86]